MKKIKKLSKAKIAKQLKSKLKKQWKELSIKLRTEQPFCSICGSNKFLNVHHLLSRQGYPEFLYENNNLIVLCCSCHQFNRKCSAHKQSIPFLIWLMNNQVEKWIWLQDVTRATVINPQLIPTS